MTNQYLIVWGVRVSGYIQYTGIEIIEGESLDNAFNNTYLDLGADDDGNVVGKSKLRGDAVVMEAHRLIQYGDATEGCGYATTELDRII